MRDLAPEIIRQRLLIEGRYTVEIDKPAIESFLSGLAARLDLRTYGTPVIHAPGGLGKEENEGFDAFIPLIDSGISLYVWTSAGFFACVLFTCKAFDADKAISFAAEYFGASEIEHASF